MSQTVLVPLPRRYLRHLRLRPGETPRAVPWGRHLVLVRSRPLEAYRGLFRGALPPFQPEEGPAS